MQVTQRQGEAAALAGWRLMLHVRRCGQHTDNTDHDLQLTTNQDAMRASKKTNT